MKKTILFNLALGLILIGTSAFVISSSGIIDTSGSPGEQTCASCHGGGGGTTVVNITGTPAFTGNQYVPGQTYTVNVQITNNLFSKFGFDCEILDASNADAGSMTTGLTGVQVVAGAKMNATHTSPKSGTGSATFSFVWVAPLSGNTTVYAAGNAVNGTGSTSGDKPAAKVLALTPDISSGVNEATHTTVSGLSVYPNPVQGELNLSYNLIEEGSVKVALFDIHGKELFEFVNEKQNIGTHTLRSALPSGLAKGIYFVKVTLEGKPSAQRLIITQ